RPRRRVVGPNGETVPAESGSTMRLPWDRVERKADDDHDEKKRDAGERDGEPEPRTFGVGRGEDGDRPREFCDPQGREQAETEVVERQQPGVPQAGLWGDDERDRNAERR